MQRILIVKITSMGDLIQLLPALTDAANAIPGIQFDWLVEESFKEIASLHPSINKIITLPYRRWKKNVKQAIQSGEITQFLRTLREQKYDMVIDAQSNLKSAFVSLLTKGTRYGLDKTSVREYGAHVVYHKKITISRLQNHAARMRQLMAAFLGYECPKSPADYGINIDALPGVDVQLPEKFIFLTPISSCANRLWPEPYWKAVISELLPLGYEFVLPWWSVEEKERVLRLKNNNPHVHILPSLTLLQKARVLSKAVAAISLDTGLSHMAAALNVPNISLYGPTNPQFTGAYGAKQIHLSASGLPCTPCLNMTCHYKGASQYHPACLETIKPDQVVRAFLE